MNGRLPLGTFYTLHYTPDKASNTAQRLWTVQKSVSHIGWGYGDYVTGRIDEIRAHFGDI